MKGCFKLDFLAVMGFVVLVAIQTTDRVRQVADGQKPAPVAPPPAPPPPVKPGVPALAMNEILTTWLARHGRPDEIYSSDTEHPTLTFWYREHLPEVAMRWELDFIPRYWIDPKRGEYDKGWRTGNQVVEANNLEDLRAKAAAEPWEVAYK